MINQLCEQIYAREHYHADYEALSRSSSLMHLRNMITIDTDSIIRLLKSATVFALSDIEEYRKQAYSIAVMVRNILSNFSGNDRKEIEAIIVIIFSRLGNFPAESKFIKEVSFEEGVLPPTLQLERQFHIGENSAHLSIDKLIVLTDFQRDLWAAMQKHKVVIVNAPTSAGKSFVLQNYVINAILDGRVNHAVYIVPSRALIEQVIISIKNILQEYNLTTDQIHITEVPHDYSDAREKIIYVLTQERVQLLLESQISIELVVVDEAQNISDGARGIILQSVVESILKRNDCARYIFAMPFVQNPDVFLSVFNLDADYVIIPSAESPVKQNLYNVLIDVHATHNVKIEQIKEEGNREYLCDIAIEAELTDEQRYLAILSVAFGKQQNNIVFGSEPSQCEKIAGLIIQLLEKKEDYELIAFSNFIKKHVHKDFLLAETILYGVAYHYGVLPSFIRKEIERLAVAGKINYVVCTSTLLQGINLPAQNIFIMKPSKGRVENNKPGMMEASEFWNLVGRAGRLTKDYEGNVFLINIQDWERQYVDEKERRQPVYSAYRSTVSQSDSELLDYIADIDHPSGAVSSQGMENSFMKLLGIYMDGGEDELSETLSYLRDDTRKKAIISRIKEASSHIHIPRELLMQNPNISAYRQQEMVEYMRKRMREEGILYLVPPHPMKKWDTIKDDYVKLFVRFGQYFKKVKNTSGFAVDAMLALRWMRGVSYSQLLQDQINYKKQKKKTHQDPNVNTEARLLFKKIDSDLRFEYVKFTKCYNDLLNYVITESQIQEDIPALPPLHLYLELGACSGTTISLIGLGMSRTSAALLSDFATNTSMNEDEVQEWLEKFNYEAFGVPETVISEAKRIIGK